MLKITSKSESNLVVAVVNKVKSGNGDNKINESKKGKFAMRKN